MNNTAEKLNIVAEEIVWCLDKWAETEKRIRRSVRNRLSGTGLSEYKIRKAIKDEIEHEKAEHADAWERSLKDAFLRQRIYEVAARMDGFFEEVEGVKIPHTVVADWDGIDGIINDPDYYDEGKEPPTGEPTDEQIEEFIRMRENNGSIDDLYNDEIWEYVENHKEEEE